ncbi:hypothetical protein C8R46DRAFT_1108190 [Mycena filopes]|nr:hypothetical protein C8R46DRAFT_1108190 [Mycena filopes]
MPARKVRFSSVDKVYSLPHPPPLSPAASSSTASPLGPLTPPPLPSMAFAVPPPHTSKKARARSSATNSQAHPLIALSATPMLHYDVSQHPSTASTHYPGVPPAAFLEPAVNPRQRALTLTTPHLPWPIHVSAASTRRYVAVADVLGAIYLALRMQATPAEFDMLRTPAVMRRVSRAYTQRCERLLGRRGYAEEKRGGLRRVDFLTGYTAFQGIEPTAGGPDVWKLTIS